MGVMKSLELALNETYGLRREPAHDRETMALHLRQEGYTDEAGLIERLDERQFDELVWDIELRQMNVAPVSDADLDDMYRASGYAEYDHDEAYDCK